MTTIFTGGVIYAGAGGFVEAFAVENGLFSGAGALSALRAEYPGAEEKTLPGPFTCAGFNDSHMHVLNYGALLERADLSERTASMRDMLRAIEEFAAARPDEKWIVARGWNDTFFEDEKRFPDRRDLDRVSLTRPVLAYRACGHILSCNTAALRAAGVTGRTRQPEGGAFDIDAAGEPTGVFRENAIGLVSGALPSADAETVRRRILNACRALNAYGVTSAQSDDLGVCGLPDEEVLRVFGELAQKGEMTVRVCEQAQLPDIDGLRAFLDSGARERYDSDFFRIGPLKLICDGSLGGATAYMRLPYVGASDRGMPLFTQEELNALVLAAHRRGMPAIMHAIGDAAADMAMDAVEAARNAVPDTDVTHGIVHCQITRRDQFARIRDLNMRVYAQPIFLDYDLRIVKARVGDALAGTSYAFGTLAQMGVPVCFGSDCPVEKPDVMRGIQCAVTRAPLSDPDAFDRMDEAYTVREAIDAFTRAGAEASGEEKRKGMIRPGMAADFVTLTENPFLADKRALGAIRAEATYVAGRLVFAQRA